MQAQRRLGNVYLLLGGGRGLVCARLRFRVFMQKQEVGTASHPCCCCSFSRVQPFATPWTAACQASLNFLEFAFIFNKELPISWNLLRLMSTESLMPPPIHPSVSFSSCLQSFPASGSFPISWLFTSGGQSTGASVSASVLPMNIQG